MAEYTPTTDGILAAWRHFRLDHDLFGKANHGRGVESLDAEVLRWLFDHDRQVAERAWDAARQRVHDAHPNCTDVCDLCIARDEILDDLSANPYRADTLAPRQDAPVVYVIDKCAIHDAPDLDCRVCAVVAAPVVSVSAEQVEAFVGRIVNERHSGESVRRAVLDFFDALGIAVTDGGA